MSGIDPALLDELAAYALGALPEEAAHVLEAQLRTSEALREELATISDALSAWEDKGAVEPSREARSRLRDALEGAHRYDPWLERLGQRLDLGLEAIRARLEGLKDAIWTETGVPGVDFVHFEPGPALAGIDTGFVRFKAGARFPQHRHRGRELTFMLEGRLAFSTGERFGPGDEIILEGGTAHALWAETDVLYVTFHEGFDLEP